ncbi:unnamed protein product [Parajaminaea phylloscopi]
MARGGSGRGGRGGGRGGRFPGIGNVLSSESTSSGGHSRTSSPNGRGGRGGALSMRGQNAVGFDYGQLGANTAGSKNSTNSDTNGDASIARTPIVPTGPKFGSNRGRRSTNNVAFPAFYTSRGTTHNSRPPEAEGDAKYLAGMSSFGRKGRPANRFRSGDPAASQSLFAPVAFVSASGEWKDGKWTGKEPEPEPEDAAQKEEGSQQRYDAIRTRKAGAGLGFSAAQQTADEDTQEEEEEATGLQLQREDDSEDHDAQVDALLTAFPESRDLDDDEDFRVLDSSFLGLTSTQLLDDGLPRATTDRSASIRGMEPKAAVTNEPPSVFKGTAQDEDDSDDEEILLAAHEQPSTSKDHVPLTAQSDSEEDRQLDAIIRAHRPDAAGVVAQDSSFAFEMDFVGEPSVSSPSPQTATRTNAQPSFVLGEKTFANATAVNAADPTAAHAALVASRQSPEVPCFDGILTDSSDEDEFVAVPGARKSSNKKNTGRKARNAAKKARRRAKKASVAGNWDADVPDATASSAPARRPRTGDSDLEWGSDGPPDVEEASSRRRRDLDDNDISPNIFRLRDLSLHHGLQPQNQLEEQRMLRQALAESTGGNVAHLATGRDASFSSIAVAPSKGKKKGLTRREREQEAILADYMENALMRQSSQTSEEADEDADLDEKTDLDAMIRFMKGMDPQSKGRQMTLGDIDDEMQMMEEEEWMTESDEDDVEDDGHTGPLGLFAQSTKDSCATKTSSSEEERIFAQSEQQEIGESGSEDSSSSESDEEAADSDGSSSESDDSESSSDEDEDEDEDEDGEDEDDALENERIFDRNFSWAKEDESFISKIERFCEDNDNIVTGKDRKARNKLFKAIETGTFEDEDLIGLAPAKKKRGKKAKNTWDDEDEEDGVFAEQLRSQWEKDRQTKAANKRKRAAERQAAAQNPFPNTHKKGTKKMAKKAARAARRAARNGDVDEEDDWDTELPSMQMANNLHQLNDQIYEFLEMHGHSTLALPPMDKRSRAQVHMLASAYSITSKSRGAGRSRFITLIKTSRSGRQVDTRKVDRILRGHSHASSFGNPGKKASALGKMKGKGRNAGPVSTQRNLEGADVGWGADRIGADNIGHKLLSMMGWAEGSGVGASQGMSEPIGAKIKTSKGGLGF